MTLIIINRIFVCVILLSISGLVFSSIYLSLEKVLYKLTSPKFMVFINTVALFSFVVPFYYIDSIMDGTEIAILQNYDVIVFDGETLYDSAISNIFEEAGFIKYIDEIWFVIAIIFLLLKIVTYIYIISNIRNKSFLIENKSWKTAFNSIKSTSSIKNVTLIGSYYTGTPFTTGVINKYIVIPSSIINELDDEEINFILSHEFYHAEQNDVARKILILVLNSLNWFNPMFYYLKDNLSNWIEVACDEAVTKNFNKKQKKKYSELIIKSLELENGAQGSYCSYYGGNNIKSIKRRILEIMSEKKKRGVCGKVFVSSLAVFSIVCGNVVAKAADVPVNKMFSENVSVVDTENIEVITSSTESEIYDESINYEKNTPEGNFTELIVDANENVTYEIIYGDGKVRSINENIQPNHSHTYEDVTIKIHEKHSDGSCTTTYYEGKQCTGCGFTLKGDVIKTVTENPCTH